MNSSGRLTLSLAGLINGSREFTNVWYIVSGNVTIGEDGIITVYALNSNGKKVNCKLLADVSGIEDVKTDSVKVSKYIENGQILINRNGKVYNIQGMQMKYLN